MVAKNDLCNRLLKFAVDVILYLRTVKNTVDIMKAVFIRNLIWPF